MHIMTWSFIWHENMSEWRTKWRLQRISSIAITDKDHTSPEITRTSTHAHVTRTYLDDTPVPREALVLGSTDIA